MVIKNWNVKEKDGKINEMLVKELKVSEFIADMLVKRGCRTKEEAENFLKGSLGDLRNPLLMKDMDRAVERINKAMQNDESVVIYGDYDVDGITSTYIFYDYLKSLGVKVEYYIPNRKGEGYGLNSRAVENIAKKNADLIITVDTGITAVAEIELAKSEGIDVVVTDHHECKEVLPDACAVVNPKRSDCEYKFKELAGVGVAFKVIVAHAMSINADIDALYEKYLEFVALGTVADVMPVIDENRIFVRFGIEKLNSTKNLGVEALLNSLYGRGGKLNSGVVSFGIAPRLNAAGRIAKAERAIELFNSKSKENAEYIAEELARMNKERQYIENEIYVKALQTVNADKKRYENVIFLYDGEWHQGIIGIVASKLTEQYSKPVLLMTYDDENPEEGEGKTFKGSGRSVKGLNLVNALAYCGDCVKKFGGHELAAGFSAYEKNLEEFEKRLNRYVGENKDENFLVQYDIDRELEKEDLTLKNIKSLNMLEPFGNHNEVPLFLISRAAVMNITSLSENKHQRITVKKDGTVYNAVYFGIKREDITFCIGDEIDLLCNVSINVYMEVENVQIIIRDTRCSCDDPAELLKQLYLYSSFSEGNYGGDSLPEKCIPSEGYIPSKADFAEVYMFIKSNEIKISEKNQISCYNYYKMYDKGRNTGYFKFRVILDVFADLNLITLKKSAYAIYELKINPQNGKVNLEDSKILINLRNLANM